MLLLAAAFVHAQEKSGVTVQVTTQNVVETPPGAAVTWTVLASNPTDRGQDLREEITLPDGWRRISPSDLSFSLNPRTTQVRIVSVLPPRATAAGPAAVTYALREAHESKPEVAVDLSTRVAAVKKLDLLSTVKPDAVIAGERYTLDFTLSNAGNAETSGEITVKGAADYQIVSSTSRFDLKAGEIQNLRVTVATPRTLKRKESHVLQVRATDASGLVASQIVSTEVFPTASGATDSFFRVPSALTFIGAKESSRQGGGQVEFAGEGALNGDGDKTVEFLFRGADLQDASMFGLRDERRVAYHQKQFDFAAGDHSFSLSPLTRRYGYGRGAEIDLHSGAFDFGLFAVKGRWTQSSQRDLGTYISRRFGQTYRLKFNYLRKSGGYYSFNRDLKENLYSLESAWKPGAYLDLNLEYAISRNSATQNLDRAARGEAKGVLLKRIQYVLNQTSAGADYYGFYNDARSGNASVSAKLTGGLSANLSLSSYASNRSRNLDKGTLAVNETTNRIGLQYSTRSRTNVVLEFLTLDRKNAFRQTDDFAERTVRASIGQSAGKLSVRTTVEKGERSAVNPLAARNVLRYGFESSYQVARSQTLNFFARFGDGTYSSDPQREQNLGAAIAMRLRRDLQANVQLARSEFNPYRLQFQDNIYLPNGQLNPEYLEKQPRFFGGKNQESIAGNVSYTLPNSHVVSLQGRWWKASVQDYAENSLALSYRIPLRLPVAARTGAARISGRIFEDSPQTKKPMSRAIVYLNDSVAISNAVGEFSFASLPAGEYLLRVDSHSLGPGRMTAEVTPRKIQLIEGANAMLNIRVTEEARIQVQMIAGGTPLENGLVEASDGHDTFREFTNAAGLVTFDHLRPGKWLVRIYDKNLPPRHSIDNPETTIELKPGERRNIAVATSVHDRPIRLIDGGTIRPPGL